MSREIDVYLANTDDETSEEINALFGFGSPFDQTHGFYIDGVSETTAILPPDWRTREIVRTIDVYGRTVRMVVPCPEDLIVSKLARLDEKDKVWIREYVSHYKCDLDLIKSGVRAAINIHAKASSIDMFLKSLSIR